MLSAAARDGMRQRKKPACADDARHRCRTVSRLHRRSIAGVTSTTPPSLT
jgi:hypothetical protein